MKYEITSAGLTLDLAELVKNYKLEYFVSGDNTVFAEITSGGSATALKAVKPKEVYDVIAGDTSEGSLRIYTAEGKTSQISVSRVSTDGVRDGADAYGNPEGAPSEEFLKVDGTNFDPSKIKVYQSGIGIRPAERTVLLQADGGGTVLESYDRPQMVLDGTGAATYVNLGTVLNEHPTISDWWRTTGVFMYGNYKQPPIESNTSAKNYVPALSNDTIDILQLSLSGLAPGICDLNCGIRLNRGLVGINTMFTSSYQGRSLSIGGNTTTINSQNINLGSWDSSLSGAVRFYRAMLFDSAALLSTTQTNMSLYSKAEVDNRIGLAITTTTYPALNTTAKTIIGAINELKAALA